MAEIKLSKRPQPHNGLIVYYLIYGKDMVLVS